MWCTFFLSSLLLMKYILITDFVSNLSGRNWPWPSEWLCSSNQTSDPTLLVEELLSTLSVHKVLTNPLLHINIGCECHVSVYLFICLFVGWIYHTYSQISLCSLYRMSKRQMGFSFCQYLKPGSVCREGPWRYEM